ncbi:hypothetical protein RB600_005927, partial [Gaeumannomyces tritici]
LSHEPDACDLAGNHHPTNTTYPQRPTRSHLARIYLTTLPPTTPFLASSHNIGFDSPAHSRFSTWPLPVAPPSVVIQPSKPTPDLATALWSSSFHLPFATMISNMKITSLVVGTLAAVAGAQDMSAFPQCAQWCINSMQQANKSQELGCAANDAACACRNQNFLYGVRDCSAQLCASFDTAGQAIGFANEYCRNQGVDLSTVTTGLPSQFTNTNMPTGSGTGTGAGTAGGSQSTGATSTMISTATGSSSGTAVSVSSATSTVPIVSTVTTDGSTFSTTVGSSTLTTQTTAAAGTTGGGNSGTTGGNGGTTGGNGGATTSSNPNYAPQMTAAPAGLLAAAGVAVFLL